MFVRFIPMRLAISFICFAGFSATGARCEMLVIESDDPAIKMGTTYPDDAVVRVAAGKHVRLRLRDKQTMLVEGPLRPEDQHSTGGVIGGTRKAD